MHGTLRTHIIIFADDFPLIVSILAYLAFKFLVLS